MVAGCSDLVRGVKLTVVARFRAQEQDVVLFGARRSCLIFLQTGFALVQEYSLLGLPTIIVERSVVAWLLSKQIVQYKLLLGQ